MPKSRETVTGSQPFRSRPGKLNIPQTLMFFTAAAEGDPNDPAQIDALSEKFELPAEVGRTLLKHFRVPMTVRDHDGVLHGAWEIDPDMEIPPLPDGQKNEIRPLTWRELEVGLLCSGMVMDRHPSHQTCFPASFAVFVSFVGISSNKDSRTVS